MPRILQNLCEHAIGMLDAGMMMKAVAMNIGCSTRAIRHVRQRFQATGCTEDRWRVAKTTTFRTPTCTVTSKLPQLLLLTPMVHITTVYLPKLCTTGGLSAQCPLCWLCFGATPPRKSC